MKGYKGDGTGPEVTKGAGLFINTLLTIYAANNQATVVDLLNWLRDPSPAMAGELTDGLGITAVLERLNQYENQRRVIDFQQMCDLMQLALNVDA
jgi:hypothetical protein